MHTKFHPVGSSHRAPRRGEKWSLALIGLWIRCLAALHRWIGRELHIARLRRLLILVENELRRRGEDPRRN